MRPEKRQTATRSLRPLWGTAVICALLLGSFLFFQPFSATKPAPLALHDQQSTLSTETPAPEATPNTAPPAESNDPATDADLKDELGLDDEPEIAKNELPSEPTAPVILIPRQSAKPAPEKKIARQRPTIKKQPKVARLAKKVLPAPEPVVAAVVVPPMVPVPAQRIVSATPLIDIETALASLAPAEVWLQTAALTQKKAPKRSLQHLVDAELESTVSDTAAVNPVEAPDFEEKFPLEPRYTEFVPVYVQDQFSDIRARLDFYKQESLKVRPSPEVDVASYGTLPVEPEPKPQPESKATEPEVAAVATAQPAAPAEAPTPFQAKVAVSGGLLAELAKEDEVADQKEEQRQQARDLEAQHLAAERAQQEALAAALKGEVEPEAAPEPVAPPVEQASVAGTLVAMAPKPEPELVVPQVTTPAPATTQSAASETTQVATTRAPLDAAAELPTVSETPATSRVAAHKPVSRRAEPVVEDTSDVDERTLQDSDSTYGKVHLDKALKQWFRASNGHMELHLIPADKADAQPQDTRFVDYRYSAARPQQDFEIDKEEMKGTYRLVARFYQPGKRRAVSSIPYEKLLSARNYKEAVHFHLSKADFKKYRHRGQNFLTDKVQLTAILFEGATGNYKKPPRIAGATVRAVGFPEWGTFTSKADGTVTIPNVPLRSELLLEVSAPGYYPTRKVVSTFGADELALVYQISRDKVEAITQYFTKNPQKEKQAIIMGRAFNEKGQPLEGEQVSLSFRKGKAVYIDSLPDLWLPATAKTGLFGFFNIVPSFRTVGRAIGQWPGFLNLKEGFAHYIEFGRGGARTLRGRIYDPVHGQSPAARVRLVGAESEKDVFTDAEGRFEIPKLDLPAGVVTLEVDSGEQYDTHWYTLPWDPRESGVEHTLIMVERDIVRESAWDFAKVKPDARKGTIVGGAEPALFERRKGCVTVSLLDSNEKPVPSEKGPFPWGQEVGSQRQALCLTSQNPRFAFYNLEPGEYVLKWRDALMGSFRPRVIYVGADRTAMVTEILSDTTTDRKSPSETEPTL